LEKSTTTNDPSSVSIAAFERYTPPVASSAPFFSTLVDKEQEDEAAAAAALRPRAYTDCTDSEQSIAGDDLATPSVATIEAEQGVLGKRMVDDVADPVLLDENASKVSRFFV